MRRRSDRINRIYRIGRMRREGASHKSFQFCKSYLQFSVSSCLRVSHHFHFLPLSYPAPAIASSDKPMCDFKLKRLEDVRSRPADDIISRRMR